MSGPKKIPIPREEFSVPMCKEKNGMNLSACSS